MADMTYIGNGVYSVQRASFIVQASPAAIRRWAFGYHRRGILHPPVVDASYHPLDGELILSFLDLIELGVIARLRREIPLSMARLRQAYRLLVDVCHISRPFAWSGLRTDGKDLFLETITGVDRSVLQLTGQRRAQYVIPRVIDDYFKDIVFAPETNYATRYFPLGREGGVEIDPQKVFGEPVVAGTRIPTRILSGYVQAGEKPDVVARWYKVSVEAVERASYFESGRWAA
ncbi:MAG: DUF433 domain-containing protein [Thermoleophilia bacterium]|nr:DUF433 domain-containing protein [Thermoleophilia bacterium]